MAMDTITTVARPYAKAAFEYALEHNELQSWSDLLFILASISLDEDVQHLIAQPGIPAHELAALYIDVAGSKVNDAGKNFVHLLADNKRLMALSEIKATFEIFKAEQEKSLEVSVISFSDMAESQKKSLASSLKARLKREITIDETIDKSILGGAIIRAGDLVIDGSVRGQLEKLRHEIVA